MIKITDLTAVPVLATLEGGGLSPRPTELKVPKSLNKQRRKDLEKLGQDTLPPPSGFPRTPASYLDFLWRSA